MFQDRLPGPADSPNGLFTQQSLILTLICKNFNPYLQKISLQTSWSILVVRVIQILAITGWTITGRIKLAGPELA